jgi:uncharacterized protein (TIGR00290 family)
MIKDLKKKVLLFWSGGKDSALTYHRLKVNPHYQVVALITTMDKEFNGIPFHGVSENHLKNQAKMMGLPLQRIFIPPDCSNEDYIKIVGNFLLKFKRAAIDTVAFGDINLEDIKEFRINFLKKLEMNALFPLWGEDTLALCEEFIRTGHRAVITAVLNDKMPTRYLGQEFNKDFLESLPTDIDPAGENGEFHTFVSFGPNYKMRVPYSKGMAKEVGPYLISKLQDP